MRSKSFMCRFSISEIRTISGYSVVSESCYFTPPLRAHPLSLPSTPRRTGKSAELSVSSGPRRRWKGTESPRTCACVAAFGNCTVTPPRASRVCGTESRSWKSAYRLKRPPKVCQRVRRPRAELSFRRKLEPPRAVIATKRAHPVRLSSVMRAPGAREGAAMPRDKARLCFTPVFMAES
jgi:hypothetical protein